MPSFEEAKRCPKCEIPGEVTKEIPAPPMAKLPKGTKIATIYCRTKRCKWYDTCWTVQVNADGTVPEPHDHTKSEKMYSGFEYDNQRAAELLDSLKAAAKYETTKGAEIRRSL